MCHLPTELLINLLDNPVPEDHMTADRAAAVLDTLIDRSNAGDETATAYLEAVLSCESEG